LKFNQIKMAVYIFKETQKLRHLLVWEFIFISIALILFKFITSKNDFVLQQIWIPIGIFFVVVLLLLSIKMKVIIDQKQLKYKYIPFIINWRIIALREIDEMELISYNSLMEFGGWGIRYNFSYWLYNTGGKHGIKVTSGKKKFILGTYKPDDASKAIAQFKSTKN
jgi:hypothetical protein